MNYIMKISIIIPAYNAATFLQRALNSIYKQSLHSLEIIIVNDYSSDDTLKIAETNQKKDNRIVIINRNNNKGSAIARNEALKVARGKYIFFFDVDDEITNSNALEILYNTAEKNQVEVVLFDFYKLYPNKAITHKTLKILPNILLTSIEDKKQLLKAGVVVFNKLYLRDFLLREQITFVANLTFDDMLFTWQVLTKANRILYLKQEFYVYWQVSNSITNVALSDARVEDALKAMKLLYNYLIDNNLYKIYSNVYELKLLTTFARYFAKSQSKSLQLFNTMADHLAIINLNDYKKSLNIYKYYKYKCFIQKRYTIYKLFFLWI
ncbi:Undecaprenyl-phosphate 4-deoxy-4-formamido-L-arabinose transferase [Candidatus Hepatincola sp. Av]